jgi:hypothetical protein
MIMNDFKLIFEKYKPKEWLLSMGTSLLFLVLFLAITLIPTITLLLLYVPYRIYFFLFIYIMGTMSLYVSNRIYISTLKNYHVFEEINYKKVLIITTTSLSVFVCITLVIINIIIN